MTKIAVCGKGGSGKSTVVALMARRLQQRGYRVLVVDSDESNPGLHRMLGFGQRPEPLLGLVGGKKRVFQAFSEAAEAPKSILTQEQIHTRDLPPEYRAEKNRITLVCVGKILQSLEGCACPMGALSREFLKRLSPEEDEMVLVDMEAGVEHFGRGVETSLDGVLAVTEPSFDSLALAERIYSLAAEVGIDDFWVILNKITSGELGARLRKQLEQKGIPIIGSISYHPEVVSAGLDGRPVRYADVESDIDAVLDQLL